jgi:DNA (cytosine-5)-methyltransferase 1
MKTIKVVELFAGVGGFRIALDKASNKNVKYDTVWANQWEPSTTRQHAAEIYEKKFGKIENLNVDIERMIEEKFDKIPNHDLLVGGFPCQDYSVAKTLSHSKGLIGKKGVLWWSIYSILKNKGKNAPDYIFLENVDRLLKSPSGQRGRDFAVMLTSLADLGYAVEWRVVNAAEYGFPQRRRRVFIVGYKKGTKPYQELSKLNDKFTNIYKDGILADAFKVKQDSVLNKIFTLDGNLAEVTENFSKDAPSTSPFYNSGVMINRNVYTAKTLPDYKGKSVVLGDVIEPDENVPPDFFITKEELKSWDYLKGAKKEPRTTKSGFEYFYSEGSMIFPDRLDMPSRTIVTGEGGTSPSRFKHVIQTPSGKFRRLTPLELERLNMFPDNHTQHEGVGNTKRAFIMGNALVIGAIQRVGESLAKKV